MDIVQALSDNRKYIEAALEYADGTHLYEDVVVGVLQGRMQLWPLSDGCLVTEIVTYPRKKVVNCFLGGGDMKEMITKQQEIIEWAKEHGCTSAAITGRFGWERAFLKHGWQKQHVVIAKDI